MELNLELLFLLSVLFISLFFFLNAAETSFLGDDEFGYFYGAKIFSEGKMKILDIYEYPMAYPGIFFSLFNSILFLIFGQSLSIMKITSAFFGMLTLIMIYLTGKKISPLLGILSAATILSVYLFTHYMFLAYTDLVITFFSSLAIYLFLKLDNFKKSIFLGTILGISYYVKSSGLVISLFIFVYSLYRTIKEKNYKPIKFAMVSIAVSLLVLSPFLIRNITSFNYPYFDIFNLFFKEQATYHVGWPHWLETQLNTVSPVKLSLFSILSAVGWTLLISSLFGFGWLTNYKSLDEKSKKLLSTSIFFILVFFLIFFITQITSLAALESRHMFIILPSLSIFSGFFLFKLKEKHKLLLTIIVVVIIVSLYQSVTTAITTSETERFPQDHINAINWIKTNTEPDDLIFTTYGGPLGYYGERFSIWASSACLGEEFPTIMTTTDGGYIKETLKECDVSYILIWRQTVAQDYIIPASNLWGIYTYNFMNLVLTDTENFLVVYSNENNAVLKILYDDEKEPTLTNITEIPFT